MITIVKKIQSVRIICGNGKKRSRSMNVGRKRFTYIIILFLSLFSSIIIKHDNILPDSSLQFLNDRAADIIGSTPLVSANLPIPPGLTGKGQIVGIADSGVDKGSMYDIHPDLKSDPGSMPRIAMLKSYSGRDIPDDPLGHGTHMAATIVGSGAASNGKYQGIAPGASLYFQALLNEDNQLDIPEEIDTLFRPAYAAGVRVHVNGWGKVQNTYSQRSAQIDEFVYKFPDFLPVFGAGNSGPAKSSITTEANSKNALTVGASQNPRPVFSTEARYADQIADSSSRGPAADGRIKPEILAPGSAVISACSSLSAGNFPQNPMYTRMGGTSMAAAVTGGATALLLEYLQDYHNMSQPSSALLKALLINGSRVTTGFPSVEKGYGILDIAGTVLALYENSFDMIDESKIISTGYVEEYKYNIEDTGRPFKATLAWVDPPAEQGKTTTLVNNFDLVVQGPDGNIYYGNDFASADKRDRINNIEQVFIPQPKPGKYKIIIEANSIVNNSITSNYSLVYGQKLKRDVVKSIEGNRIKLEDDNYINIDMRQVKVSLNGKATKDLKSIEPGSDIFYSVDSAYVMGRIWRTGGVQVVNDQDNQLVMEIDAANREGGYYAESSIISRGAAQVNDALIDDLKDIPVGAELWASINPGEQTIWQLRAGYQEKTGFIERIDSQDRTMKLLQDDNIYNIASWAAIAYDDNLVTCSYVDTPYGTGETACVNNLTPGMKVILVVSAVSNQVHYIKVERQIIVGRVKAVDAEQDIIMLEDQSQYQIFPGAPIVRDKKAADMEDLNPGDFIKALLLSGTDNIVQMQASSNVTYGKVIYFNSDKGTLYLFDLKNNFVVLQVKPETEIYKGGLQGDASFLAPGNCVRVIMAPQDTISWRIDIAETMQNTTKTFISYNPEEKIMAMSDGTYYACNDYTIITKQGYWISPVDLVPGDKVMITTLGTTPPWTDFLARVDVQISPEIIEPELQVTAYSLNGVLIVRGTTGADRISVYRENGEQEMIYPGEGGQFSRILPIMEGEDTLRVMAVDSVNGGIKGQDVAIKIYPGQPVKEDYTDISDHWAQEYIKSLSSQGIVSGFSDGSFRPDDPISRVEFITMLARANAWSISAYRNNIYFSDNQNIPWWAVEAVYAAKERGIIQGYPDGSLGADRPLTRSELAVIIGRVLGKADSGIEQDAVLPYADTEQIPDWSYKQFKTLYDKGLLQALRLEKLEPQKLVTRAEAVTTLVQLSKILPK